MLQNIYKNEYFSHNLSFFYPRQGRWEEFLIHLPSTIFRQCNGLSREAQKCLREKRA